MATPVISIEQLSKRYFLGHQGPRESYQSIRESVVKHGRSLARKTFDLVRGNQMVQGDSVEEFWALKDVSFEVHQGDVLGIIGSNGAGKSTLLKLLSRITEPTKGRITLQGRVASLLEVGTGFHPELSGRENIFLNGAILGMSRAEIRSKFDEIVDFADVERFLDTPVKRYSSGMYVRLAFAVAAHLEPEVLVVDEVLAVGDAEFQKKCMGKMGEVAKGGRTVLFVSHNLGAVVGLCSRCLLMDHGSLILDSSPAECVAAHLNQAQSQSESWVRSNLPPELLGFREIKISLLGDQPHQTLEVACEFMKSSAVHRDAMIAFDISQLSGGVIMQALPFPQGFLTEDHTSCCQRFLIQLPPLIPGSYSLSAWLGPNNLESYDFVRDCVTFEVAHSPTPGRTFLHTPDHGCIVPQTIWQSAA
ncbi:MAG: polysaccharide ABC transporter ATP-binding protein [Verrucomicrobia bacterium]|nr:polysaccharide ABC transporter ATP-binding protein [Verrucomicrobiota bacterium]